MLPWCQRLRRSRELLIFGEAKVLFGLAVVERRHFRRDFSAAVPLAGRPSQTQYLPNADPAPETLGLHPANVGSGYYASFPAKTTHLYNICTMSDQRRRRWADFVQMLYKCVVFSGIG